MEEKQNRFKSWALWMSIAALVVFCVKEFAGLDISDTVNVRLADNIREETRTDEHGEQAVYIYDEAVFTL